MHEVISCDSKTRLLKNTNVISIAPFCHDKHDADLNVQPLGADDFKHLIKGKAD